ncbi:uncharacterized protein KIAA0247-like [Notothenia coriiceps]|uniref:Uncharacterized protein KIAA0247-like n=1 Tax=Notothenia coriiceps TaxID=8208 RepID=A0A6I9NJR0_9TELE|nr:PREDICTED: uncharacterized protein KIAA0247-like [Notothenia coriiceps]
MSASVLSPSPWGRVTLMCRLLLLAASPLLAAGRLSNCTHPLVPEHGGFRCDPSPCRGFPQKSSIHFFCEPGYHVNSKVRVSRCRHGRWMPPIPACTPLRGENATITHSISFILSQATYIKCKNHPDSNSDQQR